MLISSWVRIFIEIEEQARRNGSNLYDALLFKSRSLEFCCT